MTHRNLILAIDQGTTSSRAMVFDDEARVVSKVQTEISQVYPRPGWVEQDPVEIAEKTIAVAKEAVRASGGPDAIAAIGIAVQRETVVAWDRRTGNPVANAIVWQDRRTASRCDELSDAGLANTVWSSTGLVVDPYFSATKIEWMLANLSEPNLGARADRGEIVFGNIDAWLIDQLCRGSGGKSNQGVPHLSDVSNASRTMLLNIHELTWDNELLELFAIPERSLPEVMSSSGPFAETHHSVFGKSVPIAGVAGDQQAATYGQACFNRGDVKCTYGTGAFILANAGQSSNSMFTHAAPARATTTDFPDPSGLLFTVGWQVGGHRAYATEGSVFATGSTVQWLRDQLGIIHHPSDTSDMALLAGDNEGVYMVPAFTGLGSPHWDPNARASITGISRGTNANHIARAALESTAYQVRDIVQTMRQRLRQTKRTNDTAMRADGGQSRNPFLMQFQADILDMPIEVPTVEETTAMGAAFLAGRAIGMWKSDRELANLREVAHRYEPDMTESRRSTLIAGWQEALRRTKTNFKPA